MVGATHSGPPLMHSITFRHMKQPYTAQVTFDGKGGFRTKPVRKEDKQVDPIRFLPVRIDFPGN